MKLNQLRVGNFIQVPYGDKKTWIRKIDSISGSFIVTENGRYFGDNEFDFAPLTKEWLERLGFVDESIMLKTPDRHLCLSAIVASKCYFYLSDDFGDNWSLNHIQYIHELQNLYFVLTGRELKITEQ